MEILKKFYEALANDKAMQEKSLTLNGKYRDSDLDEQAKEKSMIADIISFAKEAGFDFTEAELIAYRDSAEPVSDDELGAVVDGTYPYECKCFFGGGGKSPVCTNTGTCGCVMGGGGEADKNGDYMFCVVGGASLTEW